MLPVLVVALPRVRIAIKAVALNVLTACFIVVYGIAASTEVTPTLVIPKALNLIFTIVTNPNLAYTR